MKRILLLLFSLITTAAIGQYPINQILSSDSTMVSVGRNATGGIRGGLVNMVFADTTAANLSRISYYTGAQIWTTTDSAIWVRFKGTPSFWVKMAGASGGTTGSFWNITGNYFGGGVPLNYGVGTNSYDYLPLKTNNITRLLIPPDGILRSSAPANKYLMMDTTTLEMYYGDGGGGSGWSLTGNAGTTSSNFIGTTDNKPLVLKTNNLKRIKITADTIFVDSVNTVFENKVPYWSYPNKTYNINRLIYNSNGDRFETKINGQGTSYKHYGNSFVDSSSSPPLSAFVDTWWQNTNGVDTLLWLRGLHHSYNDTHFFLADMTNTIAPNGGIPPNRFMTVEHYGTDFFAWYNIPTYNKPITVAGGLYPAYLALGGDLGLSRYGFGVSTRKFFSLDTAYFKKHVGIGTESPDSLLTVKDGGLYANKGVRFSGLPSGIPSGAKRLLISGDGTLYAADTTAGGATPAGNYGNVQINRNGALATPGSDSLDFESATGLTVKGNINAYFNGDQSLVMQRPNTTGTSSGLRLIGETGVYYVDLLHLTSRGYSATTSFRQGEGLQIIGSSASSGFVSIGDVGGSYLKVVSKYYGASDAGVQVTAASASAVGMSVKGDASQTADLMQFRNNSNTVMARFDSIGKLGVNTVPVSYVDANGSLGAAITTTSSNITLDATHHTVIITSGTPTITLPAAASSNARRIYVVVNQTGSAVTISSYQNFSGSGTTTVAANSSIQIQSDGSNWYRIL